MDRMHTWQMFSFLLILWKDFKMTAISLIFSFQRAVKAWIIANCLYFNLNLFKWLILHLVEWFGSKIWVCKVFICSPFNCEILPLAFWEWTDISPRTVQAHPWWFMEMEGKYSDHYFGRCQANIMTKINSVFLVYFILNKVLRIV